MGVIDLREFLVQADREGELSFEHLAEGCYVEIEWEGHPGWPTLAQLTEAAQRHVREDHHVVIEGE